MKDINKAHNTKRDFRKVTDRLHDHNTQEPSSTSGSSWRGVKRSVYSAMILSHFTRQICYLERYNDVSRAA